MKSAFLAAVIAVSVLPASAGELFSGTHTYRPNSEIWNPIPAAGWWSTTMVGQYEPKSGPIPASRIECRGGGFWNKSIREATGVCVFGEAPDVWMLRYNATETDRAKRTAAGYLPMGEVDRRRRHRAVLGHNRVGDLSGRGRGCRRSEVPDPLGRRSHNPKVSVLRPTTVPRPLDCWIKRVARAIIAVRAGIHGHHLRSYSEQRDSLAGFT